MAGNTSAIRQFGVTPIRELRSRTADVGVDQNVRGERLLLKLRYFHNQFSHQVEYVGAGTLRQYFGIAGSIPNFYGADVGSLAFRAQGLETEIDWRPGSRWMVRGGWTYLDAVVEQSFSSDEIAARGGYASQNPNIPGVAIGESPFVGARPFRRPPHTGFFAVQYEGSKFSAAMTGALASRSDDSTFLDYSDLAGTNSLILPNRNLDFGYAKLDGNLTYAFRPRLRVFTELDNLLNQQHIGPIGFPGAAVYCPCGVEGAAGWRLSGERVPGRRASPRYNRPKAMQMTLTDRQVSLFRMLCVLTLLAGAVCYVLFTLHWQWMWDTSVMHYIAMALKRGKVPYKDINDINMPGAYLMERLGIGLYGGGDLGWRLWEYTLLGTMTAAMIVLARPYDWVAGLFAGVLFSVLYGSLGPYQAGQRDEGMTVLLFVGYAFLFVAMRRGVPWLMAGFGLAQGMAILIKPTVLLFAIALLLFPIFVLRRQGKRWGPYVWFGVLGLAVALGILLAFLLPGGALGAFVYSLRNLMPYYSKLAHPSLWVLVRRSLPKSVMVYALAAVVLAVTNPQKANWEMWAIRLGFLFGAFSYFAQGKGYDYHRIPYLCFGLLWAGLEFTAAMKAHGWRRNLGVAGMAVAVLLAVPFNARKIHQMQERNVAADALMGELDRLGGKRLDGKVQCMDLVGGCLSALYREGILQTTGSTGDLPFFGPDDGKVVPYYRKTLWDELQANPPEVIIVSNEWYQSSSYSFEKLETWPAFRDYLNSEYRVDMTEAASLYGNPFVYRVYVRRH